MAEKEVPQETPEAKTPEEMAAEMFGSDYKGAAPAEKEPEEPQEEVAEEAEEEVAAEEEVEEEPAEEPTQEEEPAITSLDELITQNEWDPEWAKGLKVRVKIDGQDGETTIGELIASHQMTGAAEKRLEDAKAKSTHMAEESEQARQVLHEQFGIAARMVDGVEKTLARDEKAVDWDKLRQDDPAEYSAKKIDFENRAKNITDMKKAASDDYQETSKKQVLQSQMQYQEYLQKENKLLLVKIPEWQDAAKAEAGKKEVTDYLLKEGITPEQVGQLSDHKAIMIARKAMLYDKATADGSIAKKKIAKVPKTIKPGAARPAGERQTKQVKAARLQLKKTGKLEDALGLMRAERKRTA